MMWTNISYLKTLIASMFSGCFVNIDDKTNYYGKPFVTDVLKSTTCISSC